MCMTRECSGFVVCTRGGTHRASNWLSMDIAAFSIPVIRYDAAVVATGPELFGGRLPSPHEPSHETAAPVLPAGSLTKDRIHMTYITTQDGTRIFYKDWDPRDAHPIVFHHGWPLSADDWDNQMMFFLTEGYRVIAHDRRGHGRSDQTDGGNDMDTYAADVAA